MTATRALPMEAPDGVALAQSMLGEPDAGWHAGTFGALAEFHHVDGDPDPEITLNDRGGTVVTARGAMCIALPDDARPIAYEGLSKRPDAWTHGIVFCLPVAGAEMGQRVRLTELGPDIDALRENDRKAVLFDMGLGARHADFCVRTADPSLMDVLRRHEGKSLLEPDNEAMAAIVAVSPHRVCVSRLGRVEVFQLIPSAAKGMKSPIGPHTHVLPDLLRLNRTHSANTPIPDGWLPGMYLHPPHPVTDRIGDAKAFNLAHHACFQRLLEEYAPPAYVAEKQRIGDAVLQGEDPAAYRPAGERNARRGARVALRQLLHTHADAPALALWIDVLDRTAGTCTAAG